MCAKSKCSQGCYIYAKSVFPGCYMCAKSKCSQDVTCVPSQSAHKGVTCVASSNIPRMLHVCQVKVFTGCYMCTKSKCSQGVTSVPSNKGVTCMPSQSS